MPYVGSGRALTVKQLAELVSVSQRHIRSLIAKGVIKSFRIGGCIRVAEYEVARLTQDDSSKDDPLIPIDRGRHG